MHIYIIDSIYVCTLVFCKTFELHNQLIAIRTLISCFETVKWIVRNRRKGWIKTPRQHFLHFVMTVNPMEWLSYIQNTINSSYGKICTFFTIYTYGMPIIVPYYYEG